MLEISLLTPPTKKRRPLALHDPHDLPLATAHTQLSRAGINAVFILIATLLVERITIGAVAERGAFVLNRRREHRLRGIGE